MAEAAMLRDTCAKGSRSLPLRDAGAQQGVTLLLVLAVAGLAMFGMLSWLLPLEVMAWVRIGVLPIPLPTAAALILLALGIGFTHPAHCWVPRLAASLSALLALTVVVEYVGHVDLGIDDWLPFSHLIDRAPRPDRMTLSSALAILFCAVGIWGLTMPARLTWARPMTFACAGGMAIVVLGGMWQRSDALPLIWPPAMTEIVPQTGGA